MDITIVLATYNRNDTLTATLDSFKRFQKSSIIFEIIVVDNAGNAETANLVDSYNYDLPIEYLVQLKKGKNNALNLAIDHIKGDLVVFCDDDIVAEPDWLVEIRDGAGRWPNHAVFVGRILPNIPAGQFVLPIAHHFIRGAYGVADWDAEEGPYQVWQIFGANMVVRSEIFSTGRKFNPNVGPDGTDRYIMGSETEFLSRLEKDGHIPIYLPKSLVYHQIRPEQLTKKWLQLRAIRSGLGAAAEQVKLSDATVPAVFGIPRFLLRKTVESYFKWLLSCALRKSDNFEMKIEYLILTGMVQFYRKQVPRHL